MLVAFQTLAWTQASCCFQRTIREQKHILCTVAVSPANLYRKTEFSGFISWHSYRFHTFFCVKNENFSKQNIHSHTYSLTKGKFRSKVIKEGEVICKWKLKVLKWKLLCYIYVGNTNCTDSNIIWIGSSSIIFIFKINNCFYKNADFVVFKRLVITPYTHEPHFSAWQA